MKVKAAYKIQMEAQLQQWNSWIDKLDASAERAGTMAEGDVALQPLHVAQRDEAEIMSEFNVVNTKSWGEVRESADKIWDDLQSGFGDKQIIFK